MWKLLKHFNLDLNGLKLLYVIYCMVFITQMYAVFLATNVIVNHTKYIVITEQTSKSLHFNVKEFSVKLRQLLNQSASWLSNSLLFPIMPWASLSVENNCSAWLQNLHIPQSHDIIVAYTYMTLEQEGIKLDTNHSANHRRSILHVPGSIVLENIDGRLPDGRLTSSCGIPRTKPR